MISRILFVDDEPIVLATYERELKTDFHVDTATNGQDGLNIIAKNGPCAVVVSDYQMRGMNGINFLAEVSRLTPECVRLMLTGHADLDVAITSINKGNIFRFLTKPIK